jgi:hypothetical protein
MYALEVNHRSAPLVRHLCRKITAASRDPAKVKKVCDRTLTAALNTMLSGLPLAVAKELNPSAIDEQVQRPIGTTIGDLDDQRLLPSAQGRVIRHRPV